MRRVLYFLPIFLFALPVCSQTSTPPFPSTPSDDLSLYAKLSLHTLSSPLRWKRDDWFIAGGVVGGTFLSSFADEDVLRLMNRNRNSRNDALQKIGAEYGSGLNIVLFTGAIYGASLVFENTWLRETSVLLASALSVSVVTEMALKIAVGRARPYTGLSHNQFKPFNASSDFVSFPSGHTVTAFTLSAVLSERIGNPWASVGLYSLATLCAMSRMYSRDHWLSDCVFSGALSIFTARSIVKWYEGGMKEDDGSTGLRFIPAGNRLIVAWRF